VRESLRRNQWHTEAISFRRPIFGVGSSISVQEPVWQIRPPNMNAILTRRTLLCRISIVDQIAINIMLQDKPRRIEPIIEDLTSHDMPSNTPAILPPLVSQPVVPEHLRIEIMRLETRMMDMTLWPLEEEKAVVVDQLLPAVESAKAVEIATGGIMDQLRGEEVEVSGVEIEGFRKIGDTYSEMAEFIDGCWGFLEALECVWRPGFLFRLYV
jgi:hypothetical protein